MSQNHRLLLISVPLAAALIGALAGSRIVPLIVIAGLGYGFIRLATGPLARLVGWIRLSIRWKIVAVVTLIGALFLVMSFVNSQAMDDMHEQVHRIKLTAIASPSQVIPALSDLENTQHFFLDLTPYLALSGTLLLLMMGVALAVSVIEAIRKMALGMRRIAEGDFSQAIQLPNRDELGELAYRINQTAGELARLREAAVADERARAVRERIAQVTLAQEEERRRLSRELHDELGPSLASIANRLRACQQMVRSHPQQAERELEETIKSLKGQIQGVRQLIYALRPPALDQLGLVGAVKQQVERLSQETGIQASFSVSPDVALDPLTESAVFRVVQECLSNVQRHARASQVEVSLQAAGVGLEVKVKDNGRGFDTLAMVANGQANGVGLASMRERAELLGGSLVVKSSPGSGCQVVLRIPSREVEVGAD